MSKNLILQFIVFILFFLIGCKENKTNSINPYYPVGHKWNTPFDHIIPNQNSIFILRDPFLYGDASSIEITNKYTNLKENEIRYCEYDLITSNSQFQRRNSPLYNKSRSRVRNIMTYVFDLSIPETPSFSKLKILNKTDLDAHYYSEDIYRTVESYYIFIPKENKMYWINLNDGKSKSEAIVLKWINQIVSKISFKEDLYFNYVIKKITIKNNIISIDTLSKIEDKYIIPLSETKW
mgnify:CR=1 FL=1